MKLIYRRGFVLGIDWNSVAALFRGVAIVINLRTLWDGGTNTGRVLAGLWFRELLGRFIGKTQPKSQCAKTNDRKKETRRFHIPRQIEF